jgi:hypothetical protein
MTDLDLGSVSTAPRTSRTTILRAILPLTNPDAGKK